MPVLDSEDDLSSTGFQDFTAKKLCFTILEL